MAKQNFIGYLMVGVKGFVVGVVSTAIAWLLVGLVAVPLGLAMEGGYQAIFGIAGIFVLPISLLLWGYFASKLWRWN